MNNYIPSGTSLFDVLSMVIPGGLIIALIVDNLDVHEASLILFSLLLYCTMISRQQKIYFRIWEEKHYCSKKKTLFSYLNNGKCILFSL